MPPEEKRYINFKEAIPYDLPLTSQQKQRIQKMMELYHHTTERRELPANNSMPSKDSPQKLGYNKNIFR